MSEQWKELKETIIELRDGDGTGTQQEVCKFLANYMDILEKQMQESSGDVVSKQVVIDIVDSYSESQSNVEDVTQDIISDIIVLPPADPQPCGDLISRKAILEEFENDQYHLEFCKEHHIERSISMEMVRIRLHDLPSVNPQDCDNCEVGNPCLYCRHEFEPQESEDEE